MTKQFKLITISILLTLVYSCSEEEKNQITYLTMNNIPV
jgi:hypothetical protein